MATSQAHDPGDRLGRVTSADERPARLDVGVVGAGRVGAVLGAALQRAGHRVVAVSGVSEESRDPRGPAAPRHARRRAGGRGAPGRAGRSSPCPTTRSPTSSPGWPRPGPGRPASSSRTPPGGTGWRSTRRPCEQHVLGLALHPAMTFTGTALDLDRLVDCCFGVTAPEPLRPVAEALVLEIGGRARVDRGVGPAALPRSPRARRQPPRHADRPVVAGAAGGRRGGSRRRVLGPLVAAALDNALRAGDAALTGPVARGDAGTVAEHLRQLQSLTPDIRPTYVALARATAERALASGRLQAARGRTPAGHPRDRPGAISERTARYAVRLGGRAPHRPGACGHRPGAGRRRVRRTRGGTDPRRAARRPARGSPTATSPSS